MIASVSTAASTGSRSAPEARVLALPRMSGAEAAELNRRHRWRAPLPLPGNETFSLHLLDALAPPPLPYEPRLRLSFQLGEDRFEAGLPRALMLDLMRSLDQELRLDPLPPPDLAALLLEGALLSLAEAMERRLHGPLTLHALEAQDDRAGPETTPDLAVRTILLSGGGLHQLLQLAGELPAMGRLLDGWPTGLRPLREFPVPCRLCLGSTVLTVRLLRSLQVGDAVLLQHDACALSSSGNAFTARLHVADRLGAAVRSTAAGWCLDAPLHPLERKSNVSENASSAADGFPSAGTREARTTTGVVLDETVLDALPVRLVFDAGRLDVTLGALRGMGAGSILRFEGDPGRVAIMTGDRRIGTGTLLDIDGKPGIRIDSFSEGLDGDVDDLDRGPDA